MEWVEYTAKTVDEAITEALLKFETTSDNIEYEIIQNENSGFLGIFNKQPAIIKARKKTNVNDIAKDFLNKIFDAMNFDVETTIEFDEEEFVMNVNLKGQNMGILIGKRGQTLDSIQMLLSNVVNRHSEKYVRVKVDTENYRQRRKLTLENLGKNIAHKVKRTRQEIKLEPMNPYERRIIHSILQNDKYVETHSEGEDPYRRVVITLKKNTNNKNFRNNRKKYYKKHDR